MATPVPHLVPLVRPAHPVMQLVQPARARLPVAVARPDQDHLARVRPERPAPVVHPVYARMDHEG
jgi:hypothetical protein